MELLRKEAGVIELTIQGNCNGPHATMQTDYNYELIVDPLLNKPAFVLNAEAKILYSPQDHILFKAFVIFIYDQSEEGDQLSGSELKAAAREGRSIMNTLMHGRLSPLHIAKLSDLPEPEAATEQETLDTLLAAGMRLN